MSDTSHQGQVWASGQSYEPYVGRWSRLVAREFVSWLAVLKGSRWLDVGCGTGALTETILEVAAPASIRGVDPSEGFVAFARTQVPDGRVTFATGDAQSIAEASASFDAVVAGLVLNFVGQPAIALSEFCRVTRAGGTVGVYVWDYAGEMQMMRYFWDAAAALDPAAVGLDEGRRSLICRPEPLIELFRSARLGDAEVRAIDVPTVFVSFDDYWTPFLGGQAPAPAYAMSLDEEKRTALRDRLQRTLPVARDGSIHLIARAWAAKGRRPG